MPKTFTYVGEDVNLGRFGAVKSGDLLVLTDQEAADIDGDERFEAPEPVKKPAPEQGDEAAPKKAKKPAPEQA